MLAEKVVNTIVLSDYQVTLTPVTLADQPLIRTWRNRDDIRSQMLSQDIISEEQQRRIRGVLANLLDFLRLFEPWCMRIDQE